MNNAVIGFGAGVMLSVIGLTPAAAQSPASAAPTFSKDVAPILQRSCQTCHARARSRRCRS